MHPECERASRDTGAATYDNRFAAIDASVTKALLDFRPSQERPHAGSGEVLVREIDAVWDMTWPQTWARLRPQAGKAGNGASIDNLFSPARKIVQHLLFAADV